MTGLSTITRILGTVPPGVWVAVVIANLLVTAATWRVARRRLRAAGERAAHAERIAERSRRRDVALTVASLVPAALFWGMVLAGSFHGLAAFGRNVLGWNDGSEYLVPGTLDGVSVTFGFLAFRAVHKRRDPGHSQRVVWAASLASAMVNFAYEYGYTHHNLIAGLYTALLSVFGVTIFHEFLTQFEEGAEHVRRSRRPPWGLRWLTAPASTFRAAIAWENFPAADGTPATVLNGLANLERVRQLKRDVSEARALERHQDSLARARRRTELADVLGTPPEDATAIVTTTTEPAIGSRDPETAYVPEQRRTRQPTGAIKVLADEVRTVKIPTQPATVAHWAGLWVRMCADSNLVHGSLTDDQYARDVYGVSGRTLRAVRAAAVSGGLMRRAAELRLNLPQGFTSVPTRPVNGHNFEPSAA